MLRIQKKKMTVLVLLITGFTIAALAQNNKRSPEHKAVNLQVLAKDISHDSLISVMKFWESSLGVNCGFCHAPSKDVGGRLDFASDDKHKKETARYMYRMTADINAKYFKPRKGKDDEYPMGAVTCYTCHRGHEEPTGFMMPEKEEQK